MLSGKAVRTLDTLCGSSGSSGGGADDVLTAQKRQPRVQVSPISMIVAVAVCPSPPPQHSPMLGQRASSHTVCSLSSRSFALMSTYLSPPGTVRFSQSGFRAFSCNGARSCNRAAHRLAALGRAER